MSQLYSTPALQRTLSLVGSAFLAYSAYSWSKFAWDFVRPSRIHLYKSKSPSNAQDGNWALVTGASDGIGLAFAKELLDRGFDVLLHGRNETKLRNHQADLSKQWPGRKVEIVVADASKNDDSYMRVVEKVKALPGKLRVLVNNVGGVMTFPAYVAHDAVPHGDIDNCININVRFGTHLTREVLPVLCASATGGEGTRALVINIGSIAGLMGVPYLATYSGTKGFVHGFTRALRHEVVAEGWEGVDVCGFVVGNVASNSKSHTYTSTEPRASLLEEKGQ